MSRRFNACVSALLLGAFAALVAGCDSPSRPVLTRDDGTEWDGHLVLGQTMKVNGEILEGPSTSYQVVPTNRISVDDRSLVAVGTGPYGFTVTGLARGKTTLHVYAPGVADPLDADVVVE